MGWKRSAVLVPLAGLAGVAAYDLKQRKHALLHNFPLAGHLRYTLERIGPELRQYIVTSNDEERPFSRDQRRWVYASSKGENNYFGFGTDNDLEYTQGYPIIKHRAFTDVPEITAHSRDDAWLPSPKILGGPRARRHAFRPTSIVNVSAMSFGSLSGPAIEAINAGVAQAGCLQNSGEGGISSHHRQGGELIWQIGTGYFGCRDKAGNFDLDSLLATVEDSPVRALEIKLSQGAKPGLGGLLPAAKISKEIAEIRGIEMGQDCASPSRHKAFHDVDSMLDFVEMLAEATGLPVGIKSAVGDLGFFIELAHAMASGERGVDFITIDGGEGGTGAAPLLFSDSVAFPFRLGFTAVYKIFAEAGLADAVTFIGSGKLGLPENAVVAFGLGVDMVNVGREAMLAIGCIQAQKCHTDRCPTGVATQNDWLSRGLDPTLKAVRLANYVRTLRRDLAKISDACGVDHPANLGPTDIEIVDGTIGSQTLAEVYSYEPGWGRPGREDQDQLRALLTQPR